MDMTYFLKLGYKTANPAHNDFIIKDFQRHCGIKADGIIGSITQSKMRIYDKNNYCPEVFEPIKPYIPYTNEQIESLCEKGLVGLGTAFNYCSYLYDFDVLHNLAHAILESNWGTSYIARVKNNLYGWRAYDTSPVESAVATEGKATCISLWSEWFNKEYLEPDGRYFRGNNEYCVNIVYASSSIAGINKSFLVQQLRKKLNG